MDDIKTGEGGGGSVMVARGSPYTMDLQGCMKRTDMATKARLTD